MEKRRISEKISDYNLKNILKYLIKNIDGVSRKELCENLGISFPAVSFNVKKLMEQGLVVETVEQLEEVRLGRNPKVLKLNEEYGVVIGIHIGYKNAEIIVQDITGKFLLREDFEIPKKIVFEDLKGIIVGKLTESIEKISADYFIENIVAISIAVPGIIDNENNQLISSKFYQWENIELPSEFHFNGFHTEVFWENDSNVLARGFFQKNVDLDNLLAFYMGVGIGIGIIINGKLYSGSRGMAGEMGKITFPMGDETVNLEQFISEDSLVKFARETLSITGLSFSQTLRSMDERIEDQKIRGNFKVISNYVGNFFALLIRAFDPQKVVFDGTVVRKCPNLSHMIASRLRDFTDISEEQICIADENEITMINGLYSIAMEKALELEGIDE